MINAGLPNITGGFSTCVWTDKNSHKSGIFNIDTINNWLFAGEDNDVSGNGWRNVQLSLNAKNVSNVYGSSDTVTPLTYTVRAYICYA